MRKKLSIYTSIALILCLSLFISYRNIINNNSNNNSDTNLNNTYNSTTKILLCAFLTGKFTVNITTILLLEIFLRTRLQL